MNLSSRKARRDARRHDRRRVAPMIEGMENRQVMTASVGMIGNLLSIVGSTGNDDIRIERVGSQIRAQVYTNGSLAAQGQFSNVTQVDADGGSGHDSIRNSTNVFGHLKGGIGDDTLAGGSWDDRLDGGANNDTYKFGSGHHGADTIVDPSGVDTLDFSEYGETVRFDMAQTDFQQVESYFPDDDYRQSRLTLKLPATIENATGSSSRDWIKGNALANSLRGLGGDDILEGRAGNDTLEGGAGNDTYMFVGAAALGTDSLVGTTGDGTDTLNFSEFGAAATVDLAKTAQQAVAAGKLSLKMSSIAAIEDVIGSIYADKLYGNALANRLVGFLGNDRLEGRAGDDRLEGHQGDDTYAFSGSTALGTDTLVEDDDNHGPNPDAHDKLDFTDFGHAVTVDLTTQFTQVVKSGMLSLYQSSGSVIEDITGSAYADTLRGSGAANIIKGLAGVDTIVGNGGNDTITQ